MSSTASSDRAFSRSYSARGRIATSPEGVCLNSTFITSPSIVNIPPMTYCDYDNAAGFLIEDDAIISHTEPCTILSLQFFEVAQTCCRKSVEFSADALACLRRQFQPLPRRGGSEGDAAHCSKYRIKRYLRQGFFAAAMLLVCLSPARAVQPDEIMADPAK